MSDSGDETPEPPDKDRVVFLAFSNPTKTLVEEGPTVIACMNCRNKAFTLVLTAGSRFSMVRCTACSASLGRVGWASDDES